MMKFVQADISPDCYSGWYSINGFPEQSDYWHDVMFDKFGYDSHFMTLCYLQLV